MVKEGAMGIFLIRKRLMGEGSGFLISLMAGTIFLLGLIGGPAWGQDRPRSQTEPLRPVTPIRHVIIVIGENRSFDNLFATYKPRAGQTVWNLLSKGIVNEHGLPGPHFQRAQQKRAIGSGSYRLDPSPESPFRYLPVPNTTYAPTVPFGKSHPSLQTDPGLEPSDQAFLKTGGTGLPHNSVDVRFPADMPAGPFQITRYVSYDSYTGDPVHRFFQMWQQSHFTGGRGSDREKGDPQHDLYTWVAVQTGEGGNGAQPPSPFTESSTNQGGVQMGFFNMLTGDAPYLNRLADHFSLADNYHQAVMGGTGANHVAIGTGDVVWYSDQNERPAVPPSREIENPNPLPHTNNWYVQDGYAGGSYVNCSDPKSPGVAAILSYLRSLPASPSPRCAPHHYYLVNNYKPGYHRNGSLRHQGFFVPPSPVTTIGDELSRHRISWGYFGEGFRVGTPRTSFYCDICNPFQFSGSIMTTSLKTHIKGLADFYQMIGDKTLPAVSFIKPDALVDGHPSNSKPGLFEGFAKKVVDTVRQSPYWEHTAIFITFDETGGYYDSGYIQPVDFFGDGPRVPLIVISPFSRGGHVEHTYYDHVSLLKFIEKNWGIPPVTFRSRDNLPNPVTRKDDPYVPVNAPAIGDLTELFRFPSQELTSKGRGR